MCTPSAAAPKADPRLAGFVAPKRNIVNAYTASERYTNLESDNEYYTRDNAAYRAWKADPANAGVSATKRVKIERRRGGEGMTTKEGYSAYSNRQRAERAAFDASDLGKANESESAYNARLKAAQNEYISRNQNAPIGSGGNDGFGGTVVNNPNLGSTSVSPNAASSPSVGSPTERMAAKLKQKTAQRASRASSGRRMLRIGS